MTIQHLPDSSHYTVQLTEADMHNAAAFETWLRSLKESRIDLTVLAPGKEVQNFVFLQGSDTVNFCDGMLFARTTF